ncbi:MAG: class I SAM-dependent methyltransferase [Planctomycetota bacterium]|jgi:2-polyprenyl-3-methyl-5-hydroxy-6-metoxy-1,4-benzoquinol methylase
MCEDKKDTLVNEQLDNKSPCAYCRARESLRLYPTYSISGDNFHINRCLKCHALFLSPRPTQQQLDQAYGDSYYGKGQTKFAGHIEKILDRFRSARARKVCRYITPPARILDIGCGNGRFLSYLINRGFDGYGTELPGKAAQRAAQVTDLKLKVGHHAADNFGENFFDCICMWHVFEHLTEPKETLQIIQRILKPGGYLMISLPNIESLQSRLFRGNWLHLDPPKHLLFLTASDLVSEMTEFGFKLIKRRYFSLEQNPFGIQQSILNCLLTKREVLFEALKGNVAYTKEYSRLNITLQKLFYLSTFPLFAFLAGLEAALRKGGTMELIFQKQKR